MSAHLHYLAVVEDSNSVGTYNSGQAVGNKHNWLGEGNDRKRREEGREKRQISVVQQECGEEIAKRAKGNESPRPAGLSGVRVGG